MTMLGFKVDVKDNRADLSKIRFKTYEKEKDIELMIINAASTVKKSKTCLPYFRRIQNEETRRLQAMYEYNSHYNGGDKLKCLNNPKHSLFPMVIDDKLIFRCEQCGFENRDIPDELFEWYNEVYPRDQVIIPQEKGKAWIIFDSDDLEIEGK